MEHTEIVTASEFQSYADTRQSEAVVPELIWLLIKHSVPDLTLCRIPYGDLVNIPGWDGLVETAAGHGEYVPTGLSYWEIGTGGDPQGKATEDVQKRAGALTESDRRNATYVVVTPHSTTWDQTSQTKWLNRYAALGWKGLKIVDGIQLTAWLREFPAIGRWLRKKMGLVAKAAGLSTPAEHWENLQQIIRVGDPPLPPKLFLHGRDQAATALQKIFEAKSDLLLLSAENEHDVDDFVAAYLAALDPKVQQLHGNRCLLINDHEVWGSLVTLPSRHVLIPHPNLDLPDIGQQLHLAAKKGRHAVVIPILGAAASGSSNIIMLRSPSVAPCITTPAACPGFAGRPRPATTVSRTPTRGASIAASVSQRVP